jgi:hypothetical protein
MNRNFISVIFIIFAGFVIGAQMAGGQDFYTISGTVTEDATGDPVEFVEVQVYFMGNPVGGANDVTNEDGEYSIPDVPAGTYDVDFQPPPESGLRPKLVEGVIVQDDVDLDVALQYGNKIDGFVRDTLGIGIPNIDLNVYDQFSGEQLDISGDDTDSEGYYDVFVPDGVYRIVYRPVLGERYVPVQLTDVEITADTTIDVILEGGYFVSGTVTGPGGPVAGADLDAEDSETGEKIYIQGDNTDSEGFYHITVPPGIFNISVEPPEGSNLAPAIAYNVSVLGDITLDFFLETGYLVYGTVSGPTGSGVADADINVENSDTGEELYTPGDDTDESGDYQVIVPAGNYNIYVVPQIDDRIAPAIEYDVLVSGDFLLNFNLEAGHLVTGTVSDPEASTVSDVDLDVIDPATEEELFTPHDNTDNSGVYQMIIPPGVHDIAFKPPVIPPYLAPVYLENQIIVSDVVIDVTLPYGILLTGLVQNSYQVGVEGVDIDAIDLSDTTDVPLVGDYTDSNGEFATVVAPGTYNLEIKPAKIRRLAAELLPEYSLNVDTYIEVTLDTGMAVTGTVTGHTGDPMPDVRITAVESSTQEEAFTPGNETDPAGSYEIILKPDTYDLTFSADPIYGYPDSTLYDVDILTDQVIDFQFADSEPDTEPPTVTVIAPNGGEIWPVYSNQIISWTAEDNIGVTSIDLYYSVSGSNGPFELISAGETNDGSYLWNIPPTPTEDARVKIVAHDAGANSGEDISDAAFTIYANPSDCSYIPGDTNHNGIPIELGDVIVMIAVYRGSNPPYYICECPPHGEFAPEADPNGNCVASELSDVITEIGAYRGTIEVSGCVDCPGLRRTAPVDRTGD